MGLVYIHTSVISNFDCAVSKSFSTQGRFSTVSLRVDRVRDEQSGTHLFVCLDRLVDFDPEILTKPEKRHPDLVECIERLIAMLKKCRSEDLDTHLLELKKAAKLSTINEKVVVVNLAKQVPIPLFGRVELEKSYRALLGNPPFFHLENLGVGSVNTWHGQTEVRVNGCVAISTPDADEYDSDDDLDPDPPSHDISLEGKLRIVDHANLPQLVSTCVVNSFTEARLNPKLNPVVPTILFDRFTFKICLYDFLNDILLISDPRPLTTKHGISRTAMLLLWLTVNHR